MKAIITKDRAIVSYVFNELKDYIGGKDVSIDDVDWEWHFEHDLFIQIRDQQDALCGVVCFYHYADKPGVWSPHMNMLFGQRGEKSVWAWTEAVKILKATHKDASKLLGVIPNEYPNVAAFVEKMGCKLVNETDKEKQYELELI